VMELRFEDVQVVRNKVGGVGPFAADTTRRSQSQLKTRSRVNSSHKEE
jgi:hypothetical protein